MCQLFLAAVLTSPPWITDSHRISTVTTIQLLGKVQGFAEITGSQGSLPREINMHTSDAVYWDFLKPHKHYLMEFSE